MKKPHKCCECGTFEHQVPMPIKNRVRFIDFCISHLVSALNAANIITSASCCGHGRMDGTIILEDDKWLVIMSRKQALEHFANKGRYGKKKT